MHVKSPLSLITIPGEIRNRIYEHLLLIAEGHVFHCACCCSSCTLPDDIPDLAILQVNRQINREASALLYSTSTFVVSTGRDLAGFMTKTTDFCLYTAVTETFPSRAIIRSLEIRFVADYSPTDVHEERMRELWRSQDFRGETRRKKAKYLHDLDRTASEAVWVVAGELLGMMHGLKDLTVNIEQAFCPEGCCRLVDVVARSLRRLRRKEGLRITVTGSLDDVELKGVTDALKCRDAEGIPNESSTESNSDSEDGSDSHSDDSTTTDGNDGNEDSRNNNNSDNNGHIRHGRNDRAGGQIIEDGGEPDSTDDETDSVDAASGSENEERDREGAA